MGMTCRTWCYQAAISWKDGHCWSDRVRCGCLCCWFAVYWQLRSWRVKLWKAMVFPATSFYRHVLLVTSPETSRTCISRKNWPLWPLLGIINEYDKINQHTAEFKKTYYAFWQPQTGACPKTAAPGGKAVAEAELEDTKAEKIDVADAVWTRFPPFKLWLGPPPVLLRYTKTKQRWNIKAIWSI